MTSPNEREEALFTAASVLEGRERRLFLDFACNGQPTLRARVDALLDAGNATADFFDLGIASIQQAVQDIAASPAPDPDNDDFCDFQLERMNRHIGPYKLLEKIGEGGNGVVYMAEQEKPIRRRVAIKVIKLGMDTGSVIARFEAERQALAMMDHPNIARVLDAGATQTGRPYFVMELVRGTRITDFCDDRGLETRQRLDLFIQIGHAIQHAHQKGIIHRDIKPSNILVTLHDGIPVPKVIDFGIAKATESPLTERTLFTSYAQVIGTPAYMSPEQAEMSGLDIDTRSDIYSLGVILYELLTGRPPFDPKELLRSGMDEMRRTLRETEPLRPSKKLDSLSREDLTLTAGCRHTNPPELVSQLRGDLDWVVMKALEKDRKRRYQTVNEMVLDIRHHLNDEPISARPPTRRYRLQKLVRRNKTVFASVGAIALALLMGLGASTWLLLREREASRRLFVAEQQQARLRIAAERGREDEARLRHMAETRETVIQANELLRGGDFTGADALVESMTAISPTPGGAQFFRSLGEWHAMQGRWQEAARRFAHLVQINHLEPGARPSLDHLLAAAALVESGDMAGYEDFRRAMIARFARASGLIAPDRTVKASLLLRGDHALMESLAPIIDLLAQSCDGIQPRQNMNNLDATMVAWRMISVAIGEFRRGNFEAAEDWTRSSLSFKGTNESRIATARIVHAMALRKLGRSAEAAAELALGRAQVASKFSETGKPIVGSDENWFDWVIARILLREADSLAPIEQPESDPRPSPSLSEKAATH
jgi:eukaryotic-like serine/threonine-protein kinase